MNFRTNYRPKLSRNKYGAISKNHLTRSASVGTYAMRTAAQTPEVIDLGNIYRYEEIEEDDAVHIEDLSDQGNIIIETE